MEDSDVLKAINSGNSDKKKNVSFIFTLKNRVGGLARALRVFQVKEKFKKNLIHQKLISQF
jgi:hypothetical protein